MVSSTMDENDDLHITSVNIMHRDKVIIDLSDGRTLLFSLVDMLTLVPDEVYTKADAEVDDPD